MTFPLLAAVALLFGGALGAVARVSLAGRGAVAAGVVACVLGAAGSLMSLIDGTDRTFRLAWSAPVGEVSVGVDPLSAFFLLCIFVVGGLALLYAAGYFAAAPRGAAAVAGLHVLIATMAMVVLARDVILFLVAWEAMFLASYFLVMFAAQEDEAVRAAGFTYLVASHIGVMLLVVLFGLLLRHTGSLRFAAFAAAPPAPFATLCFALALVGFGIKAGLWPLHGWLPAAHPAAPSPVSALMSGVMIKMGIYGILRILTFLGPPPVSWGLALLGIGGLSAVVGVLLALAQHDLKRLLAYHSIENIGIIALGIGAGLLGRAAGAPDIALLGFAGALLHTLNHGLFKGLLFQAAGVVMHATGSRDLESHGGLLRRLPVTGALFLIGAVAIAGLPPLNGFVSEWLVYLAAFRYARSGTPPAASAFMVMVVPLLALVGGLAAACFVKVFGVVFLGEPRTAVSARAHDIGGPMRVSMALGAAACVAIGVAPMAAVSLALRAATVLTGTSAAAAIDVMPPLASLCVVTAACVALAALLIAGRLWLLRGRRVVQSGTWDCGYVQVTARMQYSAASFAAPVLDPFAGLLFARGHRIRPDGYFPRHAVEHTALEDPGEAAVRWSLAALAAQLGRVRMLQRGPVQLYLLYVLLTLLVLLVWQVRS